METDVITFNLKERGRQHSGKARNFDVRKIADAINSPLTQERIRNRDVLGFYGHWPRLKFGLNPREGGMHNGRAALVEPAIVTTFLEADYDGNIRHREEFLNTDPGKAAARLHMGRAGGFSSAIDERVPEFYGFDYVYDPNFTANRGYSLDSASDMTPEEMDAAIQEEQLRGLIMLLDSADTRMDVASTTIEQLRAENIELLSMLASCGASPVLDSSQNNVLMVPEKHTQKFMADAASFAHERLPSIAKEGKRDPKNEALFASLMSRFSR